MTFFCPENGLRINLSQARVMGSGGEGTVYEVPNPPNLVAKIFTQPTPAKQRKLEVMLANPCAPPPRDGASPTLAWPQGLLFTCSHRQAFAGYLLSKVVGSCPTVNLYNPRSRRQKCPLFDYRYLVRAARNVASVVSLAHSRGYVIGDLNESNFLVADNARICAIDLDSWQVQDRVAGKVYRCDVAKPDFVAPELQGRVLSEVNRTEQHDRFALGVLLHKLLMEGHHPHDGMFVGSGEAPPIEVRIARGYFPHGNRAVPVVPKPTAPPSVILTPRLRELFIRCFEDGHFDPGQRPDAWTWAIALAEAENRLVACARNPQHWYGAHLNRCPWCERTALLNGLDPFPSRFAIPMPPPQPLVCAFRRTSSPSSVGSHTPPPAAPACAKGTGCLLVGLVALGIVALVDLLVSCASAGKK